MTATDKNVVDDTPTALIATALKHLIPMLLCMLLVYGVATLLLAYLRRWSFDFASMRLINRAHTRDDLLSIDPEQFEHLCRLLFEKQGYSVHTTTLRNDGGIDIAGTKDGRKIVAQCKRYTHKSVGRPELQQFYGAFEDEHAQHGFFITMSRFSKPAVEFASRKPITLVDASELIRWVNRYSDGQIERPTPSKPSQSAYDAVCASCGREATLPFKPVKGKRVYCRECYRSRRRVA